MFGLFSFYPKLFSNNLYQHPFPPPAVELAVENLLPGAEVEFAVGNGDHHFTSHDLPFHVRIGIIFAGIIVAILLIGHGALVFLAKRRNHGASRTRRR